MHIVDFLINDFHPKSAYTIGLGAIIAVLINFIFRLFQCYS